MAAKEKTPRQKKKRNRILLVVEVICIIVALVAAGMVASEAGKYYIADRDFKQITQQYDRKIAKLQKKNSDCIGWIQVDDTRIDYPVMFTPKEPEFYLHRNFEKDYSFAGVPFVGEGCEPNNSKSNSMIIHAHHMNDGSMFGELEKFNTRDFAESHVIKYKNIKGTTKYRVFGAMYVDLSGASKPYRYWDKVGVLAEEQYDDLVKQVAKRSLYSTKYKAKYGKRILMLSTCSYGTSEQRFAVFAVEDES